MHTSLSGILSLLVLTAVSATVPAAPVRFVGNGVPLAVIILPDAQAGAARKAADELNGERVSVALAAVELADYIEKATGVRLPIKGESEKPSDLAARIFVGDCSANRRLPESTGLKPEEFLLKLTDAGLHIVGGDIAGDGLPCQGTLFGVYDFLEHDLGVRWLFPGEQGEAVPKRAALEITALDRREQPRVAVRKIRDVAVSRGDTFEPWLKDWGFTVGEWRREQGDPAVKAWFRRQRLGRRIALEAGHSNAGWWELYGGEHPDFFAMQPDGTRTQASEREQLCVSNPALWDFMAEKKLAEFRMNPDKRVLSIAPNDGGKNKFCMCDKCRAMDPPNAPRLIANPMLVDPVTRRSFGEYPSLSDRYFTFFNEVTARVRRQMPDRFLSCYAYSVYRTPPVAVRALDPNLIVGFVGLDKGEIDAWSKLAKQFFIRPNDLGPSLDFGMPRNLGPWLAGMVRFSVEHHAIGFDFDNCHGNWAGHGLDYYLLAKALWKPDMDVPQTIADYCRAGYGPGAEPMQRYFACLEKISNGMRADMRLSPRGTQPWRVTEYYTPKALDELGAHLVAAQGAVSPDDINARTRISLCTNALQHARNVTALLEDVRCGKSPDSIDYQQKLANVMVHIKANVLKRTIASLHSYRYLSMALSDADPEAE